MGSQKDKGKGTHVNIQCLDRDKAQMIQRSEIFSQQRVICDAQIRVTHIILVIF